MNTNTLRKIARINFVIWLISTLVFIASITGNWSAGTYEVYGGTGYYFGTCYADGCYTTVEISHFEDGSGRVVYCLAGNYCD